MSTAMKGTTMKGTAMKSGAGSATLSEEILSYCTFRVGERLFGASILDVKEINTELDFTPVHHAPEEVEGYVNIRGQVHLILNLRKILGFAEDEHETRPRLVLFKESVGPAFGILVDHIGDILQVPTSAIEDRRKNGTPPPEGVERRAPNIGLGVCKLENELMVILNPKNLLGQITKEG